MRKSKLIKLVGLVMVLSITACMSGCGEQEEIVKAAVVEEVTLVNESEVTEESLSVATEEETQSIEESSTDETEIESVAVENYTITELNIEMQATQNAMTYENPDGITEVSGVRKDEIIAVIGKVDDTNWYQIDQEGFKSFIDGKYLKEIEVQQQQQQANNDNQNNNNQNDNKDNSQDQNKDKDQNKDTPPAQDPQPPVGGGDVIRLPDGGFIDEDGVEVHPGDKSPDGSTTYMGGGGNSADDLAGYW